MVERIRKKIIIKHITKPVESTAREGNERSFYVFQKYIKIFKTISLHK